jgi:hypothetical protein
MKWVISIGRKLNLEIFLIQYLFYLLAKKGIEVTKKLVFRCNFVGDLKKLMKHIDVNYRIE